MALKYDDYVKKVAPEEVVSNEIEEAANQQEERENSTPAEIDWQKRYEDMDKAFSRQGQTMGEYREIIDKFITNSTPDAPEPSSPEVSPITPDDIYENPDEAVRRAVDSHPAIKRVAELEEELNHSHTQNLKDQFSQKHPDYNIVAATPEFANWVYENTTRLELAKRADQFDMAAADALFTLYEAENVTSATEDAVLETVNLESPNGGEAPAPERYSRRHMLQQKTLAKQGNREAREYVRAHGAKYREALAQGNVRD
jgi:hypothetical protein